MIREKTRKDMFIHTIPCIMIIHLYKQDEGYNSQISKILGVTYSHTVKVMEKFSGSKLVTNEKRGRERWFMITKKGKAVASLLIELSKRLENEVWKC